MFWPLYPTIENFLLQHTKESFTREISWRFEIFQQLKKKLCGKKQALWRSSLYQTARLSRIEARESEK